MARLAGRCAPREPLSGRAVKPPAADPKPRLFEQLIHEIVEALSKGRLDDSVDGFHDDLVEVAQGAEDVGASADGCGDVVRQAGPRLLAGLAHGTFGLALLGACAPCKQSLADRLPSRTVPALARVEPKCNCPN